MISRNFLSKFCSIRCSPGWNHLSPWHDLGHRCGETWTWWYQILYPSIDYARVISLRQPQTSPLNLLLDIWYFMFSRAVRYFSLTKCSLSKKVEMTCLCPDLIIAACCDPSPQPTAKITRLAAVIVEGKFHVGFHLISLSHYSFKSNHGNCEFTRISVADCRLPRTSTLLLCYQQELGRP